MEQSLFLQLSLLLALAATLSIVLRALRQPLIIGYILTGFLAGPALLDLIHDHQALNSFSQIGIALLLFVIGLGLNPVTIRAASRPVLVSFGMVMAGVGGSVLLVTRLFGWTAGDSLILAAALLFSSTIIVITSLTNKREQSRLYGQIAVGILLVEDIAATLALLAVGSVGGHQGAGESLLLTGSLLVLKGILLAVGLFVAGRYFLPRAIHGFAKSQELLYIFALAWAFGVASVFYWYGFSIEVGALFAGVAMAHLAYAKEISNRLKPLRDFFILLFFVELGQNFRFNDFGQALLPALAAAAAVMLVKPLMVMTGLGLLGYTKQTGFKAAIHLSQISEFSIVLVVLAVSRGVASPRLSAIVTLTAIITIVLSAYLMKYDDGIYRRLEGLLSVFEKRRTRQELRTLENYPLVLLGYHGGGHEFVRAFRQMQQKYVVIDYDPEVIEQLEHQHINHLYGDATDLELLEEISLHDSELVVSTITDVTANLLLVRHIMGHPQRGADKPTIFVCHAANLEDAVRLYKNGASYVILPQMIGSEKASSFIKRYRSDISAYDEYRRKHIAHLQANTA